MHATDKLGENLSVQVGSLVMEGSSLSFHRTLDVGIARLHPDCTANIAKKIIPIDWIVPQVQEPAHMIVCGYPGYFRVVNGKVIEFDAYIYGAHVSTASQDQFTLQSHLDERVVLKLRFRTNRAGLDAETIKTASMGGISGGPAFQLVSKDREPEAFEYRL